MKTWTQIERMALRDNLRVRRHLRLGDDTVELWTTAGTPTRLVTVAPTEMDRIIGDRVVRRMVEAALRELRIGNARNIDTRGM